VCPARKIDSKRNMAISMKSKIVGAMLLFCCGLTSPATVDLLPDSHPDVAPVYVQEEQQPASSLQPKSDDVFRVYHVVVGALTGAAMTKGVFVGGAVYLLAWLVGGVYSALSYLLEVLGMTVNDVIAPVLGRDITKADLDRLETILMDAIDVYGEWSHKIEEKWGGGSSAEIP